jgi:4-amino-4-deoxychorismate lyase
VESPFRPDLIPPAAEVAGHDARLIETMLWDGMAFPRGPLHMARLAAGAEALGWPDPVPAARSVLEASCPAGPARVRLSVGAEGDADATVSRLPEPPEGPWRLTLAPVRLQSSDPWLRLKTTHRPAYDAVRHDLPAGVEEAVFLNERDEVCDGTITTVFFDRGAGLRTPPLACGLLPGVLRAELGAPEEVLRAEDLPRVRLWVGNALRGMIPAVWVG